MRGAERGPSGGNQEGGRTVTDLDRFIATMKELGVSVDVYPAEYGLTEVTLGGRKVSSYYANAFFIFGRKKQLKKISITEA